MSARAANYEGAGLASMVVARKECVEECALEGFHINGVSGGAVKLVAIAHPVYNVAYFGTHIGVVCGVAEKVCVAHAAANVGFVFYKILIESLAGFEITLCTGYAIKLKHSLKAGHKLVRLGHPAGLFLVVPIGGRHILECVSDKIGAFAVLSVPIVHYIKAEIKVTLVSGKAVEYKHGLDYGA